MESERHSSIQDEAAILEQRLRQKLSLGLSQADQDCNYCNEDDDEDLELIELLKLVECPVCKDVPVPPIYNCRNGHFVCDACRPQLSTQNCAYCLAEFTEMRNYPLEALVTAPVVKCDFKKYGCSEKRLSLTDYEDHVRHCWAQLWRPGEVKKLPVNNNEESHSHYNRSGDQGPGSPCPKCQHGNSPRKIKCQMCDCSLRVPTPMFVPFNYQFEACVSPELELTLQIL